MVMPYHLHMPSYFLETFTEYPFLGILTFSLNILLKEHIFTIKYSIRKILYPVTKNQHT